jgi:hypothetical protein
MSEVTRIPSATIQVRFEPLEAQVHEVPADHGRLDHHEGEQEQDEEQAGSGTSPRQHGHGDDEQDSPR